MKTHLAFKIFLPFTILFCSCRSLFIPEYDISNLPENYFICDSVVSTPVQFTLQWEPNENDSVLIDISGGTCSSLEYKSEWRKESKIDINLDAQKSRILYTDLVFSLDSESEYEISCTVTIDKKIIMDEKYIIKKNPSNKLTEQSLSTFLPLTRFNKLRPGGVKILCWDHPTDGIEFSIENIDTLDQKVFDIRDNFIISLEASRAKVTLFDENSKQNIGNNVDTRVNDFRKYQVTLLEPYEEEIDDTVSITYSIDNLIKKYKMIVTKSCPEKKLQVKDIMVRFDNTSPNPGDTLTLLLSFIDENGNEETFDDTTLFAVTIKSGCDFAKILNSKGEQKDFFEEIKQPIRVVIADEIPNYPSKLRLCVGLIPEGDEAYNRN